MTTTRTVSGFLGPANALLGILAIGFLLYRATQATGFYWQDDYGHLLISKLAWHDPSAILSVWGRPLMTLAYMPAVLGDELAVRLTSLALTAATAGLCWLIARQRAQPLASSAALLLLAQPVTATLAYSALPETVFSFVLACALYLRETNRARAAACVASLLPLARLEGLVVVLIWAGWLLLRRRFRLIPLLGVGFAVWAAAGAIVNGDVLWIVHGNPYGVFGSRYGAAGWRYLFIALPLAFGPVVAVLAVAVGFVRRIDDWFVPVIMVGMFAFYLVAWTLPAFNTTVATVYLVSVSVPVALCGSETLAAVFTRSQAFRYQFLAIPIVVALLVGSRRPVAEELVVVIALAVASTLPRRVLSLGAIVALAGTVALGLARTDPLRLGGVPLLAHDAARQLGRAAKRVQYSNSPAFCWYADVCVPNPRAFGHLRRGALLVWDSSLNPVDPIPRPEEMRSHIVWQRSASRSFLIVFQYR